MSVRIGTSGWNYPTGKGKWAGGRPLLGFDLDPAHPNVVPMQAREANVEGEGAIDMAALFRNGLRMLPESSFGC